MKLRASPDTMTVAELADRLGIHEDTVRRGIRAGTLPGTCVGTRFVIPREWVARWLAGEVMAHGGRIDRPTHPGPIALYR